MGLAWDESFVLGIEELDEQHRAIIEQFTSFSEAIQAGTAQNILADTAHFLVKYAQQHFATEEGYMERYNYPRIDEQRHEHQVFTADAGEMLKRIDEHGASRELATILTGKLTRWLIQHIRTNDREMASFVKERMKSA